MQANPCNKTNMVCWLYLFCTSEPCVRFALINEIFSVSHANVLSVHQVLVHGWPCSLFHPYEHSFVFMLTPSCNSTDRWEVCNFSQLCSIYDSPFFSRRQCRPLRQHVRTANAKTLHGSLHNNQKNIMSRQEENGFGTRKVLLP